MSRLAKKPIIVPAGITVASVAGSIEVSGPKGKLSRVFRADVPITINGSEVRVSVPKANEKKALAGTYVAHIKNMIKGVTEPFVKKLIIEGIGFKADVKGTILTMSLGFSHPVILQIPKGLTLTVEKGVITISGIDKEAVGTFSAVIRSKKKPEPYKGKGIRYDNEVIRRKEGKKASATA